MNKFYNQNIILQWAIAMIMLFVAGIIFYYWIKLMQISLFAISLIFIVTPLGQLFISPFMKLTGVYKYLSPMLLVYAPNKKRYDLHNGTSFDYLFIFRKHRGGKKWQNELLLYYIDGILEIINEIDDKKIPESIELRGSSYFFSERTAEKFGFESNKTGISEKLNILINYIDIIWMYSLSKGRICFPKIADIRTASTTGNKLKEKKQELLKMKEYLKSRSQ
jgi:hypothetical protein